jgi:hypothetical protein
MDLTVVLLSGLFHLFHLLYLVYLDGLFGIRSSQNDGLLALRKYIFLLSTPTSTPFAILSVHRILG